jgi:deoxyribodipyrimidine photo-lyase
VALHTSKDHVVFERGEILTASGKPYSVFTPYKTAWLRQVDDFFLRAYPVERHAASLAAAPAGAASDVPGLEQIGFARTNLDALKVHGSSAAAQTLFADFMQRIDAYDVARDYPAVRGPSYLSVHLRFGTISVRQLARAVRQHAAQAGPGAARGAEVWLSELIWRDFYHQVLHHLPHVVGSSCKPEYDRVRFEHGRHADEAFTAWCEGRTGYPLVDAAMAQINQTGWMHNRLRMVTASFLTKDLGIDWRRGEAYFALHLIDFDLAANNGGWQWAASTGCDAQPWFRIFNPVTQSRRFDPEGRFIRRYLPQLASLSNELIHAPWEAGPIELEAAGVELGRNYPRPIVDHAEAREKTLLRYAVVKKAPA